MIDSPAKIAQNRKYHSTFWIIVRFKFHSDDDNNKIIYDKIIFCFMKTNTIDRALNGIYPFMDNNIFNIFVPLV